MVPFASRVRERTDAPLMRQSAELAFGPTPTECFQNYVYAAKGTFTSRVRQYRTSICCVKVGKGGRGVCLTTLCLFQRLAKSLTKDWKFGR